MSNRQLWISRSKNMLPVIAEAREAFPDAESDAQALTRALFHWYHGRQENSKRGALDRIEIKLNEIIALLLEEDKTNVHRQPDREA